MLFYAVAFFGGYLEVMWRDGLEMYLMGLNIFLNIFKEGLKFKFSRNA